MPTSLSLELCQSLTRLARQLITADQPKVQTHVLAQGKVYRVIVVLEPVPVEQLHDVIQSYL